MREYPYRANRRVAAQVMGTLLVTIALLALIMAAVNGDWLSSMRRSLFGAPSVERRQPTATPTEDLRRLAPGALDKRAVPATFAELARDPKRYEGVLVKVRGRVMQVISNDAGRVELLVAITPTGSGDSTLWDDPIYVTATGAPSLLEDDVVVLYGVGQAVYSYRTALNAERTVPHLDAVLVRIEQARN